MTPTFQHKLEFAALRILEALFSVLPRTFTLNLGSLIGELLYRFKIYLPVVETNMVHVGLWNDARQRQEIQHRLYRNIGRYWSDFLHPAKSIPFTMADETTLEKCIARGKGTIVLLAHFGSWEALAVMFGKRISDLSVLAKPMHNPLVEAWLHAKRSRTGVKTIYPENALRKIAVALKHNGMVAVLIDQYAGGQGVAVPFFMGKTANTIRTVAGILQRMDCSILPGYSLMNKNGSYTVYTEETANLNISTDNADTFINAYLAEHNAILSRWITARPDHWFGWFHRRFADYVSYPPR